MFIETQSDSIKRIISITYRPPNSDVAEFNSLLNNILEKLKVSNTFCWIMGDFNIDLMKNNDYKPTIDFVNMMFANSLIPSYILILLASLCVCVILCARCVGKGADGPAQIFTF